MEDPNLGNGVYTHFLLQALTDGADDADLDGDGLVDVVEAHDYARDGTIRYTRGLQVPRAEYRLVGHEEIFLAGDVSARHAAESALVSAYAGLLASARLLIDGVPRGSLPGVVAVEPGRHRMQVLTEDGRTLAEERVRFVAGEHVSIEALLEREHHPRATASLGAVVTSSGDAFAAVLPEVELGVELPARGWVLPELHARAALGVSPWLPVDAFHRRGLGGVPAAGGWVGLGPAPRLFAVGPLVEVGLPLRSYAFGEAPMTAELSVAPIVGLRGRGALSLGGRSELVVRLDARLAGWDTPGGWRSAGLYGASVGLRF